jgi:hypothetical protein
MFKRASLLPPSCPTFVIGHLSSFLMDPRYQPAGMTVDVLLAYGEEC